MSATVYAFYRKDVKMGEVHLSDDALNLEEDMDDSRKQVMIIEAITSTFHISMQKLEAGDVIHKEGDYFHTVTEEEMELLNSLEIMEEDEDENEHEIVLKVGNREIVCPGSYTPAQIAGEFARQVNQLDRDEQADMLKLLPREFRKFFLDRSVVRFAKTNRKQQEKEYEAWKKDIMDAPEVDENIIMNASQRTH